MEAPINAPATIAEIATCLGVTKRSAERKAELENWPYIEQESSSRHKKRLYALKTLPKPLRHAIKHLRLEAAVVGLAPKRLTPIVEAISTLPAVTPKAGLFLVATGLNTGQKKKRDGRLHILSALDTLRQELGCSLDYALQTLLIKARLGELDKDLTTDLLSAKVGGGLPSHRTLQRWLSASKQGEIAPKVRQKDSEQPLWLVVFLANYRKPQQPKVMEAYRETCKDLVAGGVGELDLPSYHAVTRYLKRLPLLVLMYGRSTGSQYNAYKSFVRRDWGCVSNMYWVGDGHTFKAKVRHPEHGQPFAPEVTIIMDASSRMIVGWAFSLSENQIAVAESLGYAMLTWGKPLIYYSDNGAGQVARIIDHPIGGMMARLGIDHQTGIPGNPQGRGIIEGLWDITTIAIARTLPTFQGTGMDKETLNKNTRAINSAKTRGEVPEFVPPFAVFRDACIKGFIEYNTKHKHSSLNGETPASVYKRNADALLSMPLTADEQRDLYRPFVERMPIRGEVRLFNHVYFNNALTEIPSKNKVRVAFDLSNAEKVWISDQQGRFICEALFEGNTCEAFPKSYTDNLKDQRIDRRLKLKEKQIEEILAEKTVIDISSLQRVELAAPIVEAPLSVFKADFEQQEPEDKRMSYLETQRYIQAGNDTETAAS